MDLEFLRGVMAADRDGFRGVKFVLAGPGPCHRSVLIDDEDVAVAQLGVDNVSRVTAAATSGRPVGEVAGEGKVGAFLQLGHPVGQRGEIERRKRVDRDILADRLVPRVDHRLRPNVLHLPAETAQGNVGTVPALEILKEAQGALGGDRAPRSLRKLRVLP